MEIFRKRWFAAIFMIVIILFACLLGLYRGKLAAEEERPLENGPSVQSEMISG